MNNKPIYGYIALLEGGDPNICKAGSSYSPISRPESTFSPEKWVTVLAFLIPSRETESEWKRALEHHRIGNGGREIFRTRPVFDYVMPFLENFRGGLKQLSSIDFGGPINIAPVELGEVEAPRKQSGASLGSIQSHSIVEASSPKNPYSNVGRK